MGGGHCSKQIKPLSSYLSILDVSSASIDQLNRGEKAVSLHWDCTTSSANESKPGKFLFPHDFLWDASAHGYVTFHVLSKYLQDLYLKRKYVAGEML